jgi:hypothetical protein
MKKSVLAGVLFVLSWQIHAQQFASEMFHEGFLVTTNGDTLRGALKYNMEVNIVNLLVGGTIKTYSSQKIFYFEIFDVTVDNFRQFYSLPYEVRPGYKIPILFELQYEAPQSLLTREQIVTETVPASTMYWGGGFTQLRLVYNFYFLDKKGNMIWFSGRRKELLEIVGTKKSKSVKAYIKDNKLRTDQIQDLIRITAFFNSI